MKIVFCGPSHSGKSVFIANLIDKLPTDACTVIRACPDGEGTWSNNRNQNETNIVRKKGEFTKSFIDNACLAIDNQTNKIVLVDVGGAISEENEQIFQHCDSFFVLSNDEKKKSEWMKFGKALGLKCIGCLDSSLEGQEAIYSREPYLQGKIVGLKRGNLLENSSVIRAVVSDIVQKSKYGQETDLTNSEFSGIVIDDTALGFELGYGKEILTEDGTPIKKVRWSESALPKIYQAMQKKFTSERPVRINGIRANFVLCAICKAAKKHGVKSISAYDIRTKSYIPIKNISKEKGIKQAPGLSYNLIENKENIFLDIDITKEQYSLEDYEQCILPQIKENKNLYLSGRMPLWLLASISNSYNSNRIFTFQPGKGFTCVSSINEKELGTIVDGADGIDINQYFADKRDRNQAKLPTAVRKQGFLSKVRGWIDRLRGENIKYLNNAIKANVVSQAEATTSGKSAFQSSLQEWTSKEPKDLASSQALHVPEQENSRNIIGG